MAGKPRILLVDDEATIIKVAGKRLEVAGYEVIAAMTGTDGLALAKSEQPDLILLDIMLPWPDGYEICETLKADPQLKHIPIVMFSAKASPADQERGLRAGADAYVTKPYDPVHLLKVVDSFLKPS